MKEGIKSSIKILRSIKEAYSDYENQKLFALATFLFSFVFLFINPAVSLFITLFYLTYYYLFFVEEYLKGKKSLYKRMFMPVLEKARLYDVGYRVYDEEVDKHLEDLQDVKKLAEKEKRYKNDKKRLVGMSKNKLTRHFWILGTTGAGKTEYILNMLDKVIKQGGGFIFVDGKAETVIYKRLYTLAKKYGREHDLFVLNFLTEDISLDTNTYNPLLSSSSLSIKEFLNNLLGEPSGDQAYWQERGKKMLFPIVDYLVYFRNYYKDIYTYKDLFILNSLENYSIIAIHTFLVARAMEEYLKENYKELVEKAVEFAKVTSMFPILDSVSAYLVSFPILKRKYDIDSRKLLDLSELAKNFQVYLSEISEDWKASVVKAFEDLCKKVDFKSLLKEGRSVWFYKIKELAKDVEYGDETARQQHAYAQQQWAKVENMFSMFPHIFGAINAEVDITKLIKNNQMLYVALPALKQSAITSQTLGRMIIASVRSAMSYALDEKLALTSTQAKIRNSAVKPNPLFFLVLDEFGSYSSNVINDIIAQARSLRFSVNVATQDFTSAKGIDGKDEHTANRLWANTQKIILKVEDKEALNRINESLKEVYITMRQNLDAVTLESKSDEVSLQKEKIFDVNKLKEFSKGFGMILTDLPFPVFFQSFYLPSPPSDVEIVHFK